MVGLKTDARAEFRYSPSAALSTLPYPGHVRVGISRGIPRRMAAGFRVYRKLAPGPWFNSVEPEVYDRLYRTEVLAPLDPHVVAGALSDMAQGAIPVLLCYERPGTGQWCHRALAARWLAEAIGQPVCEVGYEHLAQEDHPLLLPRLRRITPQGQLALEG